MTIDADTRPATQLTASVTHVYTNGATQVGQSLKSVIACFLTFGALNPPCVAVLTT